MKANWMIILGFITLIALLLVGCSNEKQTLIEQAKKLQQENSLLSDKVGNYETEIKLLKKKISEMELKENQVIIDRRIDLDVLAVLFKFFEGINEDNLDKVSSTISSKGLVHGEEVIPKLRKGEQIILKEITSFSEDNVGRPRYIINVRWKQGDHNVFRMFVFHKIDNAWKIVDID